MTASVCCACVIFYTLDACVRKSIETDVCNQICSVGIEWDILRAMTDYRANVAYKKECFDRCVSLKPLACDEMDAFFDIELTYTSNALELNGMSREDVEGVYRSGAPSSFRDMEDVAEVQAHFQALDYVRARAVEGAPFVQGDIRAIHSLVGAGTVHECGEYSPFPRRASGGGLSFPPPDNIAPLMDAFSVWLSEAQPTCEVAIEAHLRLVNIHPFSDGNGRTARLLMNAILLRGGYPPLVIDPGDREAYLDVLEGIQPHGQTRAYEDFMLHCLTESFDRAFAILQPSVIVGPMSDPQGPAM